MRRWRLFSLISISPVVADVLGPLKKRLARDADLELKNRLGDDLRLIASELEKLALYVGDRPQITRDDVEAIVAPVREEEFFALAEAVGEGDTAKALQLFADDLRRKANASAVALPFLGGVASAVRKALADSARYAGTGARELGYNEFQAKLFPGLEAELSGKGQRVPHPFAAWLGYKRSRRRPRAFWRRALIGCAEVDFELKNGADSRFADRGPIDLRVRADLHVVFDDDVGVLRNLQVRAVLLPGEPEAVAADDDAVVERDDCR